VTANGVIPRDIFEIIKVLLWYYYLLNRMFVGLMVKITRITTKKYENTEIVPRIPGMD
jgi:hypothetical protein